VGKATDQAEIRGNYLRLSRLVHPDKCSHQQAADATAVVNQVRGSLHSPAISCTGNYSNVRFGLQAYDTLRTAVKKALYDR
jgi:hypothetical protein